jgi:hypothetical protein
MAMLFLKAELTEMQGRAYCGCKQIFIERELFQSDAKCEQDFIVLGGWDSSSTDDPSLAKWYSLRLEREDVPWMFKDKKGSSWASTSAELLAAWVSLELFVGAISDREVLYSTAAGTDNQANEAVTEKRSSTKWPLGMIMMQFSRSMRKKNLLLKLRWKPREFNQPADDLTNGKFDSFDPKLRIPISWAELKKEVLDMLAPFAEEFSLDLQQRSKRREQFRSLLLTKKQKLESKTPWG